MDIAGHVSKRMLKHYSHIRMDAKRRAVAALIADEKNSTGSMQKEGNDKVERDPKGLGKVAV